MVLQLHRLRAHPRTIAATLARLRLHGQQRALHKARTRVKARPHQNIRRRQMPLQQLKLDLVVIHRQKNLSLRAHGQETDPSNRQRTVGQPIQSVSHQWAPTCQEKTAPSLIA